MILVFFVCCYLFSFNFQVNFVVLLSSLPPLTQSVSVYFSWLCLSIVLQNLNQIFVTFWENFGNFSVLSAVFNCTPQPPTPLSYIDLVKQNVAWNTYYRNKNDIYIKWFNLVDTCVYYCYCLMNAKMLNTLKILPNSNAPVNVIYLTTKREFNYTGLVNYKMLFTHQINLL